MSGKWFGKVFPDVPTGYVVVLVMVMLDCRAGDLGLVIACFRGTRGSHWWWLLKGGMLKWWLRKLGWPNETQPVKLLCSVGFMPALVQTPASDFFFN